VQCGTIVDQGINESLQTLRAASQETDVISIDKVCELQVPDLHPSSQSCGLYLEYACVDATVAADVANSACLEVLTVTLPRLENLL